MRAVRVATLAIAAVSVITGPSARAVRAQSAPAPPTAVAATTLGDIRSWDAVVDRMSRDGDLRVRATFDDTLMPGRVHERLDEGVMGSGVVCRSCHLSGTGYPQGQCRKN